MSLAPLLNAEMRAEFASMVHVDGTARLQVRAHARVRACSIGLCDLRGCGRCTLVVICMGMLVFFVTGRETG